ncbi:IS200/IS605 family transposase [Roseibacillus ishigakijimensis]|uniref:IS200/IS605 family transposase n=1 Tax=Roseibacillus ishigakijimensis TaxID=454146 RepID=A0A934VKS1_9BACT|nr:IS200/IS605 family transposase [Roseibacillus ishigakijimensis]MBK1833944.1 IS200/IS605 family transposase [Roseibacillus ishigakijimensis]
MSSTYTSLLYHLVFSTKNREKLLHGDWRSDLHDYLGGVVNGLGGKSLAVGGVADHVHLLVSLKATLCLADFMRELKKSSSRWVKGKNPAFSWQDGYAALTVSASNLEAVRAYIARQEEHHRSRSFREELVEFLEKSGVSYDPQYLD